MIYHTRPRSYKIEVTELVGEVPKELEDDFNEWVLNLPSEFGNGKGHEYYSPTEDYTQDVGVFFYITSIYE